MQSTEWRDSEHNGKNIISYFLDKRLVSRIPFLNETGNTMNWHFSGETISTASIHQKKVFNIFGHQSNAN